MQASVSARLLGILLTSILFLAPGLALADVYKCVEGNQTTYSSEPCGKHPQEVRAPLSVTPAFVPPEPVSEGSSGGSLMGKLGLSGKDVVTALLVLLIPLSLMVMFMFARRSGNAK